MPDASPPSTPRTVRDNIQTIIELEEEHDRRTSLGDRLGHAIGTFAGTVTFVLLHLVALAAWVAVNTGATGLRPFDPYPFNLLSTVVSMEGVLLSTFVLIKQNRMGRRADRRNHLDLQVNLLTEQEVTKVIQMLQAVSAHLGIEGDAVDREARELGRMTEVGDLARELNTTLPGRHSVSRCAKCRCRRRWPRRADGGGAAGGGRGAAVTVYDRMPSVGRKLQIAGRGGLNLTHSEPLPRFLGRYAGAAGVIGPAVGAWRPEALRAWCAGLGQDTFVGTSGRVFPVAFKATPLLRAWLGRLARQGVVVRTGWRWAGWDGSALRFGTPDGPALVRADATVLAMGGASWPRLGSDGGWVGALREADIKVSPLRPANCGFLHPWSPMFRERFAGAPLKRVTLTFRGEVATGEAVLTQDGIEGGVVYALSRTLREAVDAEGSATPLLDLRPDLDAAALTARLGGRGVSQSNALRRAGLSPAAAGLVREIGGEGPLAERVKALPLRLVGTRGLDRAISTAGGVALGEVDTGFMLLRRPGVFACGEMLDWEAPTGGYLLQASFSTGRAAAEGVLTWLGRSADADYPPAASSG